MGGHDPRPTTLSARAAGRALTIVGQRAFLGDARLLLLPVVVPVPPVVRLLFGGAARHVQSHVHRVRPVSLNESNKNHFLSLFLEHRTWNS